jgi:DNA-binding LacI/PurR family transcriptional regulator
MAQLRRDAGLTHRATLALLNAHQDREAFTTHPTIPSYVEGCRRKADANGYGIDEFWLHDPELDGKKLSRILRSRNIRGVIITGLMKDNRLPKRFLPVWKSYPCVVTGVRTREPALHFACADHHILVLRAVENALRLGYRRPALVIDPIIDRLVDHRFTSGYGTALRELPEKDRPLPFEDVSGARRDPDLFRRWFETERPDVILTLYHEVRRWLHGMDLEVPQDVALIQLEWREDHPEWAGMCQHNDIVGEAAVEMLLGLIHQDEVGIPLYPRATLIGSSWVNGKTVRRGGARRRGKA